MVQSNSLVIYKNKPARVLCVGEKISIEVIGGDTFNVRPKDIQVLHPGPFVSFDELNPPPGELEAAWEILLETSSGADPSSLASLSDLIYGEFSPASAWGVWLALEDQIYFERSPGGVLPRSREAVAQTLTDRAQQAVDKAAWEAFLVQVRAGRIDPEADAGYLREVEDLAQGRRASSKVLQALGRGQRPEVAHGFLLEHRIWTEQKNPHPVRLNLSIRPPDIEIPDLAEEARTDLTHLEAYAIDDQDNRDPDDAISWDGERLWVHIADAAALVAADSQMDLEARSRGATLYLPEGAVPMLPHKVIDHLGIGLQDRSPALSFGLQLNEAGIIDSVEILRSWVQVQRLSYAEAETRLEEALFPRLLEIAERYQNRRLESGALFIDLPEVIVRVVEGQVMIRPVVPFKSRMIVREAMLLAGEGAAQFARKHNIPFPYASQPPLDESGLNVRVPSPDAPPDFAVFFALRRAMAPSEVKVTPALHAGIGLSIYSRVTSPLRRYLDLVAHQQLRAFLDGKEPLEDQEILARIGASQAVIGEVNRAERMAQRHWTLVFLLQNPGWVGEGVLVERRGRRARLVIPELALEFHKNVPVDWPLNSRLELRSTGVNLPELEAFFEIVTA
jgi:exoribonuclease-2